MIGHSGDFRRNNGSNNGRATRAFRNGVSRHALDRSFAVRINSVAEPKPAVIKADNIKADKREGTPAALDRGGIHPHVVGVMKAISHNSLHRGIFGLHASDRRVKM